VIGLLAMATAITTGADPRCAARITVFQPRRGMISTPRIALKVARAYLDAIYGADNIERELPLR